jgi:hypothetical protein
MLIKESMMYVCTYSKRKYIRHRKRHHKCAQLSAPAILHNRDSELSGMRYNNPTNSAPSGMGDIKGNLSNGKKITLPPLT